MEERNKPDGGITINVNSSGNFFAKTMNFTAPVNIGGGETKSVERQEGYTDEQIAAAIEAICGEGKPLDKKQKWAGVHWLLRWECNFPAKPKDFIERLSRLPLPDDLPVKCEYRNIREISTLAFMNEDPRQLESVKYSKNDEQVFFQMREVVRALAAELHQI